MKQPKERIVFCGNFYENNMKLKKLRFLHEREMEYNFNRSIIDMYSYCPLVLANDGVRTTFYNGCVLQKKVKKRIFHLIFYSLTSACMQISTRVDIKIQSRAGLKNFK